VEHGPFKLREFGVMLEKVEKELATVNDDYMGFDDSDQDMEDYDCDICRF